MTLVWEEPENDGGAEITGYCFEKREESRTSWVGVGSVRGNVTSNTIKHLYEGNSYYFRVMAENSVGTSEHAETAVAAQAKCPYDPPSVPKNLKITEASGSEISISWNEPAKDGGSAITNYIIERRKVKGFSPRWQRHNRRSVISTNYTMTDVIANADYEIRIACESAGGISQYTPALAVTAKEPFSKFLYFSFTPIGGFKCQDHKGLKFKVV